MTALIKKCELWRLLLLTLALTEPFQLGVAVGQTAACRGEIDYSDGNGVLDPCVDPSTHPALKDTIHFLCLRPHVEFANCNLPKAIGVGFVGGFVKPDDVKHPEVLFAHYLRSRYGSAIHTEIFGNHDVKGAVEHLSSWLN